MQSSFFDYFRFLASGSNPQFVYVPPFPQWVQETVYLGGGIQSLQWQFQASSFGSGYYGLDFGWVDQVSYVLGATPATITSLTADQILLAATNVAFTVSAVGTPALRYQWQFNGTNITNATGPTFSLTNLQQWNSGTYTVIVTNAYGNVSSNVNLTVVPVPPTIITQPTNQVCWIGSNVTFQVAAEGSVPFTYQWQFNGTNIDYATNATFSLANLQKTNAGIYQVFVKNDYGNTTSTNAQLWVVRSAVVAWGGNSYGDTNGAYRSLDREGNDYLGWQQL